MSAPAALTVTFQYFLFEGNTNQRSQKEVNTVKKIPGKEIFLYLCSNPNNPLIKSL